MKRSSVFARALCLAFCLFVACGGVWAAEPNPIGNTNTVEDLSLEDLMKVVVSTASKKDERVVDAPAIVSVISAKEIELYGALTLADVLDRVTSSFFLGTYIASNNIVSLRGDVTPNYNTHVLVLIDGRPFRDSLVGGFNAPLYMGFPVDGIDHIEIIRGPGSVLYGTNAYSGVINIFTKKTAKEAQASLLYGANHTAQGAASAATTFGDLQLNLSAQYMGSKGWDFTMRDEAGVLNTMQARQDDLGLIARAKYRGLSADVFFADNHQNSIGRTPVWSNPAGPYRVDDTRLFMDVGYEVKPFEGWTSTWNATYNQYRSKFFLPAVTTSVYDSYRSDDLILEWSNRFQVFSNLDFVAGGLVNMINGAALKYDQLSNGAPFNLVNGENVDPYVIVAPYRQTWWGAYFQADYSPLSWVHLVGGGQLNQVTNLDVDFVPRIGAIFRAFEHWTGKVLYGEAFRSATGFERGVQAPPILNGNAHLSPERIRTTEIQVSYTEKDYEVSGTVFNSIQQDRIDRTTIGFTVPTYVNLGQVYSYGLELEGRVNFLGGFSAQCGGTYLRTKRSDDLVFDSADMPTLLLKVGVGYSGFAGVRVGLFDSFFGGFQGLGSTTTKYVNDPATPFHYLTANATFDLGVLSSRKYLEGVSLGVYGTNLLNADVNYPEYVRQRIDSIPGRSGTAVYGSLAYRL